MVKTEDSPSVTEIPPAQVCARIQRRPIASRPASPSLPTSLVPSITRSAATLRTFQLRTVVVVLLATLLFDRPLPAQPPGHTDNSVQSNHGSVRILRESLPQLGDVENVILALESELHAAEQNPEHTASALQLLTAVLQQFDDATILNADNGSTWSSRHRAIELLRQSGPAIRHAWRTTMEPAAADQLRLAISDHNPGALDRICQAYPLTESGLQAGFLRTEILLREGQQQHAEVLLLNLEQMYAIVPAEAKFAVPLQQLRAHVDEFRNQVTDDHIPHRLAVSIDSDPAVNNACRPWVQPLWRWNESPFLIPDLPTYPAFQLVDVLSHETGGDWNHFANWRPILWRNQLIHRTPFQLIAVDPKTGAVLWQMRTDTYIPTSGIAAPNGDNNRLGGLSNDQVQFIHSDTAFGLLSADDHYLYFLDHLDLLGNRRYARDATPGGVPYRLVALRMGENDLIPTIAWTHCESPDQFHYDIVRPAGRPDNALTTSISPAPAAGEVSSDSTAEESAATPFQGHQFLTAPVGYEDQVFAL
ncbi:MAG: hypothetical protein KDA96_22760, partial [Planctomycetaceae bacterium]|nr:hypothetical protein [Planctomycetaceae bacterium]